MTRRRFLVLVVIAALLVVMSFPAMLAGLRAQDQLGSARSDLLDARKAIEQLNVSEAERRLASAKDHVEAADSDLSSWTVTPALLVPVVRQNLRVAKAIAAGAGEIVEAGEAASAVSEFLPLAGGKLAIPWSGGRLDLDPFEKSVDLAGQVEGHAGRALAEAENAPRRLLLPPVNRARQEFLSMALEAKRHADVAAGAAFLIPRLFGGEGHRTWILGAENNAELRGRGGFVGSFGILTAEEGKLGLGEFQAVSSLPEFTGDDTEPIPAEYRSSYAGLGGLGAWQNLFMSPHFPSGARLFVNRLNQTLGTNAEGIVTIDPVGLSYLMELTGPLTVEGIPEPIDSANVVDWSLSRAYFSFADQEERREQLSKITETVWGHLVSSDHLDASKLSEVMGRALAERRMVVFSTHRSEQERIEELGIGGAVRESDGDYLLLAAQNFGENKLDYYLERTITYKGRIRVDGMLLAEMTIRIKNTAPSEPLPGHVGGDRPGIELSAGRARNYLMLFVPVRAVLTEVRKGGAETDDFENLAELGKRKFATYVELGPQEEQEITFEYSIPRVLDRGQYSLTLQNQAVVRADHLTIDIDLPDGASVESGNGISAGDRIRFEGEVTSTRRLEASLEDPLLMRAAQAFSALPVLIWVSLLAAGVVLVGAGIFVLRGRRRSSSIFLENAG